LDIPIQADRFFDARGHRCGMNQRVSTRPAFSSDFGRQLCSRAGDVVGSVLWAGGVKAFGSRRGVNTHRFDAA
jgi:hypothetical protein